MSRPAQVDEFLFASGKRANPADLALLEKYDRLVASQYCRPGCGDCLGACPANLPINDVLRYTMYFDTYGAEREAMKKYAKVVSKLGHGTEVCASCSAPCEARCPYGIPIKEKLGRADRILRLET
jgi:predicted aldo/keto reductase-like oxidoreductase